MPPAPPDGQPSRPRPSVRRGDRGHAAPGTLPRARGLGANHPGRRRTRPRPFPAWTGLAHRLEEVFTAHHPRVVCTHCHRNLAFPAVCRGRAARPAGAVTVRDLGPAGRLRRGLRTGPIIAAAKSRAA